MLVSAQLATGAAAATTDTWLIGGGPDIESSQAQIEANVRWLESLLLERGARVRTYFGLGPHPGKDVVHWRGPAADDRVRERLARIFGEPGTHGLVFARHELRAVRGSTQKHELVPALEAGFRRHDAARDALLVYIGHGGLERGDTNGNHLRLWGDEPLDVRELDTVLDALPAGTTARFVMTQCYSGAFHSLVYEDPDRRDRVEAGRCGFSSESALSQAEGCALAVDEDEYRDYGTYFFAALDGETRLGEPIDAARVDRDGDGRTSFREAHLHTLSTAHSADLPRSTSEAYLVDWTPWYLQWDTSLDARGSVYWTIADEVAERYGWRASPPELEAQRDRLLSVERELRRRRNAARAEAESLQERLRNALMKRWPELRLPYAPGYVRLLAAEGPEIAAYVEGDARYERLVGLQDELVGLGRDMLDATRHLTQIDKIHHLRTLGRLETALQRYGDRRDRSDYATLLECEQGHLEGY